MFNDFNTINPVEWFITKEVFELTQAKLKVGRVIDSACVAYCRCIAIHAYHLAGMKRQEMTNRSRPTPRVKNTVLLSRHCDAFYQPELCFVPKALDGPIRP